MRFALVLALAGCDRVLQLAPVTTRPPLPHELPGWACQPGEFAAAPVQIYTAVTNNFTYADLRGFAVGENGSALDRLLPFPADLPSQELVFGSNATYVSPAGTRDGQWLYVSHAGAVVAAAGAPVNGGFASPMPTIGLGDVRPGGVAVIGNGQIMIAARADGTFGEYALDAGTWSLVATYDAAALLGEAGPIGQPNLSFDALVLLFTTGDAIYYTERAAVDQPFAGPANVLAPYAGAITPTLTSDGCTLYVESLTPTPHVDKLEPVAM